MKQEDLGSMLIIKTWIISIGNELLIGKIVDSNSAWLAKKLTILGYNVRKMLTILDDEDEIVKAYREAVKEADIVISTGGLGPTYDDKTSESLAKAFNKKWVINPEAYEEVKKKFEEANMDLTEARIKMAKMPENAKPLYNSAGIAPGILLKIENKSIIALPGVPKEVKAIFEESLEKILREKAPHKYYNEKSIKVVGIPESSAAEYVEKVMKKYHGNIYIKTHPKGHEIKGPILEIHVTTYAKTRDKGEEILNKVLSELIKLLEKAEATVEN